MLAGYSQVMSGLELYDLKNDISEQHDVADQHPDVVRRLQALAEKARDDLGDRLTKRKGKNRRSAGKIESATRPAG